eukprot:4754855-Pyramimonas_sp.AAC.1
MLFGSGPSGDPSGVLLEPPWGSPQGPPTAPSNPVGAPKNAPEGTHQKGPKYMFGGPASGCMVQHEFGPLRGPR